MNNRRLYKEIHGVECPRKPPQRANHSTQKPPRSFKYRAWIRSLPCASCGQDPAGEAAHTGSDGGMQQKPSDYSCIPLCTDCHTQAPDAYHRIGKAAFEVRRNVHLAKLVKRLNSLWFDPRTRNVQ